MKRKLLFKLRSLPAVLCSVLLLCIGCEKQNLEGSATGDTPKLNKTSFVRQSNLQNKLRVFGYFFRADNDFSKYMDSLDLPQLTDIALSFVNPDHQGVFTIDNKVSDAVVKGHQAGVRMYFSFGGGNSATYFDTLLYAGNRTKFIANITKVATDHNFDGVDVDLEGERVTSNYNAFIIQLADSLHKHAKKLSISISTWKGAIVSNSAYTKVDYINSQSYGGPPEGGSGTRAPLSDFISDFEYFKNTKGIPASKFNGGVPFYGDNFTSGASSGTISYKAIINQFPNAYSLNHKYLDPYKVSYFDGHPRIKQKVQYALEQGMGGIMIWQISFDTKDKTSLLKLINQTASLNGSFDPGQSYYILNRTSNKPMEVVNSSIIDGAAIQQGPNVIAPSRLWNITTSGLQVYAIKNQNSSKVMDITGSSTLDGAALVQWAPGDTNNQKFRLTANSLGYYSIININSNKSLEVVNSSTADGATISQRTTSSGNNQQWILRTTN